MIRKPKIHPKYNINLVGISFRERWNIVEFATKSELETYIANFKHIKKSKKDIALSDWWTRRQSTINESVQNTYLRKIWRKRHSESFKFDTLYRIDKNLTRWQTKLGPVTGEGIGSPYYFDRHRRHVLNKNDIVMLTKIDEMGNLYFTKASEIDAKHPYVFNRENAYLGFILPVEP